MVSKMCHNDSKWPATSSGSHVLSRTGLYIYASLSPLLSTSSLYNHPLSWTPHRLSSHSHLLCPPPPYTTIHSAGHPSLFTLHLVSTSSLYNHPLSWTPHPYRFPTFLLTVICVHLPPIQPSTQLDTPLSLQTSHSHLLSTSPLYNHPLSWTPHPSFLLFYCTIHLLTIQPSTQLDTPPFLLFY
jgi:hypothetical protein